MAGQGPQAGPSVEHGREPCPDRILDDMGSAFGMGAVGGGIFHFLKAVKNSPRNARMRGGLEVIGLLFHASRKSFAHFRLSGVFSPRGLMISALFSC